MTTSYRFKGSFWLDKSNLELILFQPPMFNDLTHCFVHVDKNQLCCDVRRCFGALCGIQHILKKNHDTYGQGQRFLMRTKWHFKPLRTTSVWEGQKVNVICMKFEVDVRKVSVVVLLGGKRKWPATLESLLMSQNRVWRRGWLWWWFIIKSIYNIECTSHGYEISHSKSTLARLRQD